MKTITLENNEVELLESLLFSALLKDYFCSEKLTRKARNAYRRIMGKLRKETN